MPTASSETSFQVLVYTSIQLQQSLRDSIQSSRRDCESQGLLHAASRLREFFKNCRHLNPNRVFGGFRRALCVPDPGDPGDEARNSIWLEFEATIEGERFKTLI